MKFELHYKLHSPLPNNAKLLAFVALFKAKAHEEVKSGGISNNFAYVTCAGNSGVAIFKKLYLDTRSKDKHYLEFSLWLENPDLPNRSMYLGSPQIQRDCVYKVRGDNVFRTAEFFPGLPPRPAPTAPVKTQGEGITFTRIIPDCARPGDTVYLNFSWRGNREASGEIFCVWDEIIMHVPYISMPKSKTEKLIVIQEVPNRENLIRKGNVEVYLKEKPVQQSSRVGIRSNTLTFRYCVDSSFSSTLSDGNSINSISGSLTDFRTTGSDYGSGYSSSTTNNNDFQGSDYSFSQGSDFFYPLPLTTDNLIYPIMDNIEDVNNDDDNF